MKKIFTTSHTNQKGFTLLFSVLVATLIVSIGASIISIALRQTILSGTSRESQYAFYAANTILECAFYWDITNPTVFQGPGVSSINSNDAGEINCAGVNIVTGGAIWDISTSDETLFRIDMQDVSNDPLSTDLRCGEARVIKSSNTGIITTRIEAKGYNVSCDDLEAGMPRTVERGLIQEYQS